MSNKTSWSNRDNLICYEALPSEVLQQYARDVGLATHHDLKAIQSYIDSANSILEVGAGSGRSLRYLIENAPQATLHTVEACTKYQKALKEQFDNKITLHAGSVLEKEIDHEFDLILWLWAGIADFAPKEQIQALEILLAKLQPDGLLVCDTLPTTVSPTLNFKRKGQAFVIDTNYGTINTYGVTPSEIEEYVKKLNAKVLEHRLYQTAKAQSRILHLIKKNN
jgi:trans-aconitate methyltransferase